MELTHEFTVPASKEVTWAALNDIGGVAECFPGATVTTAEGDSFAGSVKVKLGPIALVYNGTGTFVEKDEAAGLMKIEAKGKDKRGNGTAGADVVATLTEEAGSTRVQVRTDLAITGKPAQFGRGVMQDVSDKLLAQFVDNLQGRLTGPEPDTSPSGDGVLAEGDVDAGPASVPSGAAAGAGAVAGDQDAGAASVPPPTRAQPRPISSAPSAGKHAAGDDSLDLGAAVLPVLLKSYGKQVGLVALVVALVVWLSRRRSA